MKDRRPVYSQEIFWPIERIWYRRIKEEGDKIVSSAKYNKYLFEICHELESRNWEGVTDSISLIPGYYTLYGVNKHFKKRITKSHQSLAHILIDDFTLFIEKGYIHIPGSMIKVSEEFLYRRHNKTGEIFREVLVTRAAREGRYFLKDFITEAYGDVFYIFYGPVASYVDKMHAERSSHEILSRFFIGSHSEKFGWPCEYYQGVINNQTDDNSKRTFIERIMNYFYGPEKWYSNYLSSVPEVTFEYIGRELVPPTPDESINGVIRYKEHSYTFPSSYVKSKIVMGNEAMDLDTLEPGTLIQISEAEKIIMEARKKNSD